MLSYAGNVGTGWNARTARDLHARLVALETATPTLAIEAITPGRWSRRSAGGERWVRPELVAEVSFREWTPEGHIRHAVFVALRLDKPAREVTREVAAARRRDARRRRHRRRRRASRSATPTASSIRRPGSPRSRWCATTKASPSESCRTCAIGRSRSSARPRASPASCSSRSTPRRACPACASSTRSSGPATRRCSPSTASTRWSRRRR